MKFSFLRFVQWTGIAIVLVALVGLNFNFESKAGKTVNAPVENSLSQSMRGSWFLDDGSGTNATDSSGNANTLAMTGSPSWTTGQIGPYALDFSGTGQYLSVADPASGVLDFGDGADFAVSGWFNRDTFAADHTLVAKKNDQTTSAGYVVWIDNNGSTDYISAEISDGTDTYSAIGATNLSSTGWHQFSIVWDDSTGLYIYLDGKLDGSTTSSTTSINSLANALAFTIGAESDAGVPFDGKIDNITLYGHALSANEVFSLYQTVVPIQPVDTGLVGHWTFDGNDVDWGNASTEIKDVSGKGNDGDASGLTTASAIRGKLGQALSFNGSSDYVDIASQVNMLPVYRYNTTYSVSFWMKGPTNQGSAKLYAEAAANGPGQQFLWIESDDNGASGKIQILIKNQAGTLVLNALSTGTAFDNTWHHVAWVDSNGVAKLYIDSTQDATNFNYTRSGTFTGINTTAFGAQLLDGYATGFVSVVLDDVRVYNRALSSVEITSLYNTGR